MFEVIAQAYYKMEVFVQVRQNEQFLNLRGIIARSFRRFTIAGDANVVSLPYAGSVI